MLHVDKRDYGKPFPNFGKPKIIGFIGLENLKYACRVTDERVNFDLNLHLDKVKRKPADLDVKLTELLKFLIEHEARLKFPLENNLEAAKFFCYRGLLTCVACTPFENKEPWKIVAILYKGNIYLCARETEEKRQRKLRMSEKDKQFTSWGYKFEQYMLSERPDIEPNPNVPVDETEEFSLVLTTHLNHHKIVYGAEMDGIICDKSPVAPLPDTEGNPDNIVQYLSSNMFIELKTNRHIESSRQEINFKRYKTRKWWCQSFLVGIDTLLCGYRNDDGIVEELKVYNVKDLAKMSEMYWKPNVCFNFLDTFLTYVKRCLAKKIKHKFGQKALNNLQALPLTSLLFVWTPGSSVQVSDNYSHEDDPILLEWFIENFGKHLTDIL
ncbi:decapping and exoribonuclease protein-like [Pararge aegeria]|nr:decapping and exoribonuclease protein-like [Pararge aegeria]XP_039745357.1 decapping and exoribonuclease protein-like [Pararge aegeria]XP_039745358.1 decapping and exoribonuclease protein-like [Pararge aegeria]